MFEWHVIRLRYHEFVILKILLLLEEIIYRRIWKIGAAAIYPSSDVIEQKFEFLLDERLLGLIQSVNKLSDSLSDD